MPNPYRTIQGPEGPIDFPAQMSDDEVTQAMRKLYPPKVKTPVNTPTGSISAAPTGALPWLEELKGDVLYGTGFTSIGRGLRALGAPGLSRGTPEEVGKIMGGPVYGVPETLHGLGTIPSHPMRGALEAGSGLFHTFGAYGAATNPEFLPIAARFSIIQAGASALGNRMGLQPETNEFLSMLLAMGGTGATLDKDMLRNRAVKAEADNLRASRGFGSQVNEEAIQRAAEENVAKAEAQANSIQNLAKQTGQDTARLLQSGAAAITSPHNQEKAEGKQNVPAAAPVLTPEKVQARIENVEQQTRALTPVERVRELSKRIQGEDAVEQARRRAPETPPRTAPLENLVPEAQRASKIIPRLEQEKLAEKMESRGAAKQELEKPLPSTPEVRDQDSLNPPGPEKPAEIFKPQEGERVRSPNEQMFDRVQELRAQGLTEAEQVFKLVKEFPQQAEAIANAYGVKRPTRLEVKQADMKGRQIAARKEYLAQRIQETQRPQVGGEPAQAPPAQPAPEPIQAASPTTGPGESVRPATQPEVGERLGQREPRSTGEEKPPTPPVPAPQPHRVLNAVERFQLQRDMVTSMQADPKFKGVAKSRLQEIAAEKIREQHGAFGMGGPEDIRARRDAKINSWIKTLQDPYADPHALDNAYKMLTAYGLGPDEIIQRAGFTDEHIDLQLRERLEARLGKSKEEIQKFFSDYQKPESLALIEQRSVGREDISGVMSPVREAVEEIGKLKDPRKWEREDERGSLSFRKIRQPPPTGSSLNDLTNKLESSLKAIAPNDSRMAFAERLDRAITDGWDKTQLALGRISAQATALKDMYMREPAMTDYRSSIGRFSGALNRSAWELRQFTKAIKEKIPDQLRREAITNWIQAGGDDQVLADRAARSKGRLRTGYEAARTLTDDEKNLASFVTQHFDQRLKDAISSGLMQDGLDNYVPQLWKAKDQGNIAAYLSSITRGGVLKPDFNMAKRRIFDSYFEGEQAGRAPINKDIGFLVSAWDKAFNQALASRALIRDLTNGTAKDGRPIVAPSGAGKPVFDVSTPLEGEKPNAYFIFPKTSLDETGDYRALNHSALTKWTWATKDENGAPIFVKGDLRVHPDHAQTLDNVINRGKWAAQHPVQTSILKASTFFKQTLLSMSPFHQVQEGTHALFHKINPFNPGQIDLTDPTLNKLLDHGLVIGNYDPVAAFDEGLNSTGLIGKVPGIGPFMQKYSEYLFSDYIPRLKAKMGTAAYERNMKFYAKRLADGEITSDQIAELTANQANAAFGELNYVMLGRSPQTQAMLRMAFLAPDFLEARARFVGQALRPYGREQYAALFRGALGMYTTARILNQLLDDDPHWDKPFSLVVRGYEYKMRSVPGDVWHLIQDPDSFTLHRLNPLVVRSGLEAITGRDDFGRKRLLSEQIMDTVRGMTPIILQGGLKSGNRDLTGSMMSGFGVTRSKYRSAAATLAHQYAINAIPNDITSHHIMEMVRDMEQGKLDGNKIGSLLLEGKMTPHDIQTAQKLAQLPEFYRDWYRLPLEQKAKVFEAATPKERALLMSFDKRQLDTTRLLPQQRQEFEKALLEK